jgi:4-hydroxy-tetrahydrodipicolinate reductase
MSRPVRVGIIGANGRMGSRLVTLAEADGRLEVVARVTRGEPLASFDPQRIDAVIDFSTREQAPQTAQWCATHGVPLVLGTTGLSDASQAAIHSAASVVPVVAAPNFSVGVNALFALAGELAAMVGPDWDLEVVEAHHGEKVDAPSGTAKRLVEVLARSRVDLANASVTAGRDGVVGARPTDEIGVHAVRGGDVIGDHTVFYLGPGEQIQLHHHAQNRDIFVQGALRAARWLGAADRETSGLFDMADVLRSGG